MEERNVKLVSDSWKSLIKLMKFDTSKNLSMTSFNEMHSRKVLLSYSS